MRSWLLSVLTLALLFYSGWMISCGEKYPRPQNVLFITVDTLRADHLGCYGYARNTSPNIDRLADAGTRFDRAIAQASQTLPSFVSMMTSLYPDRTGVQFNASLLGDTGKTLAEYFGEQGFQTAAVISNPIIHNRSGLQRGFQHFDDKMTVRVFNRKAFEKKASHVTENALAWLEAGGRSPFFLWLHYQDPHGPYTPPPLYQRSFVNDPHYRAGTVLEVGESNWDRGKIPAYQKLPYERDAAYYIAQYDGEIEYLDRQIGDLLAGLESMGLKEETLIVFTSDHGESLGENNLYFMHGVSARAPETNIPLFFVYPPVFTPGRIIRTPVEAVDIAPTILDLFRIRHSAMEGRAVLPILKGKGAKDFFYTQSGSGGWERAFIFHPWKVVINYRENETYLFNLDQDPGEEKNLVSEEEDLLQNLLDKIPGRFIKKDFEQEESPLDENMRRRMKALGYLE